MNQSSFTSADAVPYKLFRNASVMEALSLGSVPLTHLQFVPTNRCNLHCSFCSCENRTRNDEMSLAEVEELVAEVAGLGCRSVTITGGGEPLLHPHIDEIITAFYENGIEIGLVTNGELLDRLDTGDLLTWCRISASDERPLPEAVIRAVKRFDTDWAFSYVLTEQPDISNLKLHVACAEAYAFTHVRVVADLLKPESVPMQAVRSHVKSPLVIWQDRTHPEQGSCVCHVSQLKPQIAADGQVYPCCGVQYAQEEPSLDFTMAMGHWRDLPFAPFDGTRCVRCYYGAYNRAIESLTGAVCHAEFV
jgi:organic radical activating enzyme